MHPKEQHALHVGRVMPRADRRPASRHHSNRGSQSPPLRSDPTCLDSPATICQPPSANMQLPARTYSMRVGVSAQALCGHGCTLSHLPLRLSHLPLRLLLPAAAALSCWCHTPALCCRLPVATTP